MDSIGKRQEAGFSLIEVLVALTILAVGLLGLALLQTTAIRGNAIASRSSIALKVGQDKLEWFRGQSWASIASSNGSIVDNSTLADVYATLPANPGGDNAFAGGTTFYRVWRVSPSPSGTLRTITVWTCWRDERSVWHNVMLATEMAN